MSSGDLQRLWELAAFRPGGRFSLLAAEHVPFDQLTHSPRFEDALLRSVTGGMAGREGPNLVFGPTGAGKSSLISWVCRQLPETHVPLRVPVAVLDDPSDLKVLAGSAIAAAVRQTEHLTGEQRADLDRSAADRIVVGPGGTSRGGKLGGGSLPAELSLDIQALRESFERDGLPVDRLHGLDRLVSVYAARDKYLVVVFEDTDRMTGGPGTLADRFLNAVRVLSRELDAPMIVAVQDHHAGPAYELLRREALEVPIPRLERPASALRAVIARRLDVVPGLTVDAVLDDAAIDDLASLYEQTAGNLREVLAVLQFALDGAVDENAEKLRRGNIRYGISTALPRRPVAP